MPSFKKRVHSQRIPQYERPAVTPYEGSYNEKYSSDEENIEYEVDEPEDLMERSNSTVTFSEDIYDSDTIDEIIRNQTRKPSQISQDNFAKNEDIQTIVDPVKSPKGILKEKEGDKKKESPTLAFIEIEPKEALKSTPSQNRSPISESSAEASNILEDRITKKISLPATSEKDKVQQKGEKFLENVTKPLQDIIAKETDRKAEKVSSVKGEKEVNQIPESSIPIYFDQITDLAATNIDGFTEKNQQILESVTKPHEDSLLESTMSKGLKSENVCLNVMRPSEKLISKKDISEPTKKDSKIKLQIFETNFLKNIESDLEKLNQKVNSEKDGVIEISYQSLNQDCQVLQETTSEDKNPNKFKCVEDKKNNEISQKEIQPTAVLKTDENDKIKSQSPKADNISKSILNVQSEKVLGALNYEFFEGNKNKENDKNDDNYMKSSSSVVKANTTSPVDSSVSGVPEPIDQVIEEVTTSPINAIAQKYEKSFPVCSKEEAIRKQNATKKAAELIEDITTAVEEVFPSRELPTKNTEDEFHGIKISSTLEKSITEDSKYSSKFSQELNTIPNEISSVKSYLVKKSKELMNEKKSTKEEQQFSEKSKKKTNKATDVLMSFPDKVTEVEDSAQLIGNNNEHKPDVKATNKNSEEINQLETMTDIKHISILPEIFKKELPSTISKDIINTLDKKIILDNESVKEIKVSNNTTKCIPFEKSLEKFDNENKKTKHITLTGDKFLKTISNVDILKEKTPSQTFDAVSEAAKTFVEEITKKSEDLLKDMNKLIENEIPNDADELKENTATETNKHDNYEKIQPNEISFKKGSSQVSKINDLFSDDIEEFSGTNKLAQAMRHKTSDTLTKEEVIDPLKLPKNAAFSNTGELIDQINLKTNILKCNSQNKIEEDTYKNTNELTAQVTDNANIKNSEEITFSENSTVSNKAQEESKESMKIESIKDKNESHKLDQLDSESKPRVIFRIESEDELVSDAENEGNTKSELHSPTDDFAKIVEKELKPTLEKEQMKLEERLTPFKGGIFDISDESVSRTKELVDKRLRKISEVKPPKEIDQQIKRDKIIEKTDAVEEIKIGRFHITPALVEEVVIKKKEKEIADRIKSGRQEGVVHEEVEKELSEKLTEADFEEVIRELQLEGLKTDVYFQPENQIKEEKKERTLKRVERRFERMASETLEKEKEEAKSVSEEKLDEKREVEFQQMLSQLSSEEVAESQEEYQQIWEEGGLSSLTPTDDWESRDPDTPEIELDDDSSRKSGEMDSFLEGESNNASFYIKSKDNFKNNELIKKESPVNTYIQYNCDFDTQIVRQKSESSPEDSPDTFGFQFDFSNFLSRLK